MVRRRKHTFKGFGVTFDKETYRLNLIKKLLDDRSRDVRGLAENRELIEKTMKEYLEKKGYNVYLSKMSMQRHIRIFTAPLLSKNDVADFKTTFNLMDYTLEKDEKTLHGQYYFQTRN